MSSAPKAEVSKATYPRTPLTPLASVPVVPARKGTTNFWQDFMMGGVSAAISKTAAAPIERIKLILQTQDSNPKILASGRKYKGIVDCFQRVVREEGSKELWRGNLANVIRTSLLKNSTFRLRILTKRFFVPTTLILTLGNSFLAIWLQEVQQELPHC